MNNKQYFSKWQRLKEIVLINFLKDIPTEFLGGNIRNLLYRQIFPKIGRSAYIQYGVEIMGAYCVEIGDYAKILRGVNIDARGHQNNRICLKKESSLQHGVDIRALNNTSIEIDEGTFIGPYVCMAGPGDIKIGKDCLIAAHSGIFANNHIFADPIENIGRQGVTRKGIVIEDDCWLGHKVTVLDGVTIGRGSVIGAGAVVTKDIPPFSIAVGIPARVIKSRNDKQDCLSSSNNR